MRVAYRVGTDLEYAAIQEFGGTVRAKNAKSLHFEIDGEDIFVQSVTIPAQPYLRPAFDTMRWAAREEIGRVLGQLARAT